MMETLSNLWVLMLSIMTFGIHGQRQNLTLDNPELMTLPFGVAAALSTVLFFGALSVWVIKMHLRLI